MNNLDKILASDSVVKAYITPDNKFLKVENAVNIHGNILEFKKIEL